MHEDLIAWDEDERKQCREEWEIRICAAQYSARESGKLVDYADCLDEAGLAAVRELRKLRRLTDTARTVRA